MFHSLLESVSGENPDTGGTVQGSVLFYTDN
jgi:hypothetical protein